MASNEELIAASQTTGMSNADLIEAANRLLSVQVSPSVFDRELLEDPNLDKETGAPFEARAFVGLIVKPEDRLAAVRQMFPDAEAVGGGENFVFCSPETGQPTLFNPSGLDIGDVAGVAREGLQLFGSLGAAAAA